jgi:hypothetical protein
MALLLGLATGLGLFTAEYTDKPRNPYSSESAAPYDRSPTHPGGGGRPRSSSAGSGFAGGLLGVTRLACRLQVDEVVGAAEVDGFDVVDLGGGDGAVWAADLALVVVALECFGALHFPASRTGAFA